jgi:hypothetical protein
MSNITRHVGIVRSTGSRVFVVYREIPDDPEHCIIIYQDSIPEVFSQTVSSLVHGQGQNSPNLWEVMDKVGVLDGRKMLNVLHGHGFLRKQRTCDIDLHLGGNNKICLAELNESISEQKATTEHKDGTVADYNPFDPKRISDNVERVTIVDKLIADAEQYRQLYTDTLERAYSIDPTRRPLGDDTPETADNSTFTITLEDGISQTKAIEAVKKALAARKAQ